MDRRRDEWKFPINEWTEEWQELKKAITWVGQGKDRRRRRGSRITSIILKSDASAALKINSPVLSFHLSLSLSSFFSLTPPYQPLFIDTYTSAAPILQMYILQSTMEIHSTTHHSKCWPRKRRRRGGAGIDSAPGKGDEDDQECGLRIQYPSFKQQ